VDACGEGVTEETTFSDDFDLELQLLLEAIQVKYHQDFRGYAKASLRRRMRVAMSQLGATSISGLQEKLFHEKDFYARLSTYLTVPTTEMFRDPAYFRAIREHVAPVLRTYPSLKIWIAGCSTGEELYSMAILLAEEQLLERTLIYATDINQESLEKARSGIYTLEQMRGYSAAYLRAGGKASLSDYYTAAYKAVTMDRRLRERVVFADHSLATDSVFAENHFISCRNVLIYFERELQSRAIGLFHDSLVRHGFLGLGSQESLQFTRYKDAFDPIVASVRLFRKADGHG
jgi:chemotaxis protein methyltransferase CheR